MNAKAIPLDVFFEKLINMQGGDTVCKHWVEIENGRDESVDICVKLNRQHPDCTNCQFFNL